MDNCHFGDKMLRQLDIFQDLVPDRDCDVFVRNELSQPGCQPTRNWDTGEHDACIHLAVKLACSFDIKYNVEYRYISIIIHF